MEALTGPRDLARARRDIVAAGYKDERVVIWPLATYTTTCSERRSLSMSCARLG